MNPTLIKMMLFTAQQGCRIIKDIYDSRICHTDTDLIREKYDQNRLKDFQTLADTQAEITIRGILQKHFPQIGFFGEESSSGNVQDFAEKPYFMLDPLDGTSNFVAGRDCFAISLGYIENQIPRIGVIADPVTGDAVVAETGKGAYRFRVYDMDGKKLPQAQQIDLSHTQLDCEFSFTSQRDMDVMALLTPFSMGMRKHGSTALDIFMMACGRRSAMIANNQKPYDIAAGLVIAKEVGLITTDWAGRPAQITTPDIVIANPRAHERILALLKGI